MSLDDLESHLHFPAKVACGDPLLFWSLAKAFAQSGLWGEYDALLKCDWSELIGEEDYQVIAGDLAAVLFTKPDLNRLQYISEGFDPSVHLTYFQRLRKLARAPETDHSNPCVDWLLSQGLLGRGLDGFKQALWAGHVDAAKLMHQATPLEAESIFYERPELLNKESLSLLCFICPSISSHRSLTHAMDRKAPEEIALFLCWKMESFLDKSELRYPNGNESEAITLITLALSHGYGQVAKRLIEWCPTLVFEKLLPKELPAPWDNDTQPIKLEGNVALLVSEWATLYMHDPLGRALKLCEAPAPNVAKIKALIVALTPFLNGRRPGSGATWASTRTQSCAQFAKRFWNVAG